MSALAIVLLVCALLSLCAAVVVGMKACTNVQANVFIWPARVACGDPPAPRLIAAVDDVLMRDGLADVLSPGSVQALEAIARDVGAERVVCAMRRLIEGYSIPPGMAPAQAYLSRAGRAQRFLDEHGIEVSP